MKKAFIRFYEELNDYLPPAQRKREFEISLSGKDTVREIIEKLGVPAAQVDLLLVNGRSSDLDETVHEGDRISVYPVFERFDIQGLSRVRDKPLRRLSFIVDRDLRSLVESLKRLGLDARSSDEFECEEIRRDDRRILLTLRRDVAGSRDPARVIVLSPGSLHEQVEQVIEALDLRIESSQEGRHGPNR